MWPWTERRRELIQQVSFYFPKTQDEVNPESEDEVLRLTGRRELIPKVR